MSTVLDVLLLRRVRLDYVSPPICVVSGSGVSIMVEPVIGPPAPTGMQFGGECTRFLTWDLAPEANCTVLYKAQNPQDPLTSYILEADCLAPGQMSMCSEGWWQYTTLTPDGTESDPSDPILVPVGVGRGTMDIVLPTGAVRVNIYRNEDPNNEFGTYRLVFTTTSTTIFEVCDENGLYKLQNVSENGSSDLSAPIAHSMAADCIPHVLNDIVGAPESYCVGMPYSTSFVAIDGTGPFVWELYSGTLPAGLTFDSSATGDTTTISGTPTVGGNYNIEIKVTDSLARSVIAPFEIDGITIDQAPALPDATLGVAYSEQLTVTGGVSPFTFSVIFGALPDGFSLSSSGLLTGTASDLPGLFTFTIRVTDGVGISCDVDVTLTVECVVPAGTQSFSWSSPSMPLSSTIFKSIYDTSRRHILVEYLNPSSASFVFAELSTATNAATAEYLDGGTGQTFGTGWIGYDPVHDVVGIASREVAGVRHWTRFNPSDGTFLSVGLQGIEIGQDNYAFRLAVDTKRGRFMGTRLGRFEIVEMTKTSFSSLNVSSDQGVTFGCPCYNEVSDRYVILIDGANPAILYVDPATYAVSASNINQTEGGMSGRLIYSLPGTPWVAFTNSANHLVIVNTLTDTVWWEDSTALAYSQMNDIVYDYCGKRLVFTADNIYVVFDVINKQVTAGPSVTTNGFASYKQMHFDVLANLTYLIDGGGAEATHHIKTNL